MYCRTCGNKLDENAEVCVSCGCPPLAGRAYCQNCGAKTIEQQELCTKCGVRLEFAPSGKSNQVTDKAITGLGIGVLIVMIVVAIAFPPLFIVWLIIGGIISIYDKNKKKGQINSKK